MLQQISENYNQLSNSFSSTQKRAIIVSILFLDSLIFGLTYGKGLLNFVDSLLLDKLPTDLIWLMQIIESITCLLYTSPSPRDRQKSRMPSSA